ncbi:MAG: ADP-ribosylglycohydrolase family protein [Bacillota bacterium]|nr:ADP-ribosylglycohydrolase family protein [Bacillota bacterium]
MISRKDKLLGGMWGLLVGDAAGVPYEFHSDDEIALLDYIDIIPPKNFERSHNSVKAGTWSDDGAQALCLLDSLIYCGKLELQDFAERLLKWYEEGYFAVDENVFDVGIQTAESLRAFRNGMSPEKSGMIRINGKGNGSLMRVLPLALWHKGSDEELVEDAHKQSLVTHGHTCNQVCCAIYCLLSRKILNGLDISEGYAEAVKSLRNIYSKYPKFEEELEWSIRPDENAVGHGDGYVVDCLRSAIMVLKENDTYEKVIKAAISLGNDTDTTAAVAGGIAGIKYGVQSIPQKWMKIMRGKDLVEDVFEKLIK